MKIAIAGCGALGSQIALGIATPENELTLFDYDTVDETNVLTGTSAYTLRDIGFLKANALAGILYNKYGHEAKCVYKRIEKSSHFKGFDLIVDCFDNVPSRQLTTGFNTVHVGVSAQFVGSVTWDKSWQLPTQTNEENLVCTHQVGRNIISLTSSVAIALINRWIETKQQINRAVKGWEVF